MIRNQCQPVGPSSWAARRHFLQVGALYGAGITLPHWLAARQANAHALGKFAKSCIMIWLDGGPSQIDTFDPKPDAPAEVRGPFTAISTRVPGLRLSELFPLLADRMDRVALIRSLTSPLGEHNLGTTYLMTGYRPSTVVQHPSLMSSLAWYQDRKEILAPSEMPRLVAIPHERVGGADFSFQGFLPSQYGPFPLGSDPASRVTSPNASEPDFAVRNLNFDPRTLERMRRRFEFRNELAEGQGVDPLTAQAFALLSSRSAKEAFDLRRESEETRRRYGLKTIGQSCLLSRRLVEAGVPLVTVVNHGWDTHADVITRLRDGYVGAKIPVGLGPSLDQALSALLDDLRDRGLMEETLVVVMGEFGRTPKWNAAGGRDHWPRVFSVLLAGGPIRGGICWGASDRNGESPTDNPVTPADLCHTILRSMGMDATVQLPSPDGRPILVADPGGRAIEGLFA